MRSDLKKLKSAWEAAGQKYFSAFEKAYPVGSSICWEKRDSPQLGTVIGHCYQDSLRVRNDVTGKEYRIHSYWIR